MVVKHDPILHFTFSGNALDESGLGHHGAVLNASLTTDTFGNEESAYLFIDSSFIEVLDSDWLDFHANQLTVSAWIRPSFIAWSYIVQKTNEVIPSGELSQGGGPFSLDIFPAKSRALIYGQDGSYVMLTGTTPIKYQVWQHLALTWDGDIAKLFYNGSEEATDTFNVPILRTNGNLYVGAYKWSFPDASFKGKIDNVRIYNRALSEAEIQDLYVNYK
jgi:hypothetical protein